MKASEIPKFGNLQGLKVLSTGSVIAGPFAAGLFSEQGAEVIQVESVLIPDMLRYFGDTWSDLHRNQRAIAMDIPSPEARPILEKMIKWADIMIESSKGGTWDKWGLGDEVLWQWNPKLVIVHVSGFGQTGHPDYVGRPSFDVVGQAFSGYMSINGEADPNPPYAPKPFLCDFTSAIFAAWGALSAYHRVQQTGKGESVDVAQYESLVRLQGNYLMDGINKGKEFPRMGNHDIVGAQSTPERTKDGRWYYVASGGAGPLKRLEKLIGLEGDPDFAEPHNIIPKAKPAMAEKFVKAFKEYFLKHTPEELDEIFIKNGIPSSPIMTYKMMLENEHYKQRGTFTTWYDEITGKEVTGPAAVPKYKNSPVKVFRGGPKYGQDTDDILADFGFSADEIKSFHEKEVVKKS